MVLEEIVEWRHVGLFCPKCDPIAEVGHDLGQHDKIVPLHLARSLLALQKRVVLGVGDSWKSDRKGLIQKR